MDMHVDEGLRIADSTLNSGVERSNGDTQPERKKKSAAGKLSGLNALRKMLMLMAKVRATSFQRVHVDEHLRPDDGHELQTASLLIQPSSVLTCTTTSEHDGRLPTTSDSTAISGPENGRKWNEWTGSYFGRGLLQKYFYGDDSIWHLILYGVVEDETEKYEKTDILCSLAFIVSLIVVTAMVWRSFKPSPQESHIYTTDNPMENMRDGSLYTCGCILPPSLQSPENLGIGPEKSKNLNICYNPSSLDTVTVLMFPNSTAEPAITKMIQDTSSKPTYVTMNKSTGWNVTLEFHELTVQNPFTDDFYHDWAQLYRGGKRQPSALASLEYLLSASFAVSSFPGGYVQINWVYDCKNCSTCSLGRVNNLGRKVVDEAWLSCYYYGTDDQCGTPAHNYTGKCVLYPPDGIPTQFAVQTFLTIFQNLSGITNIRLKISQQDINYTNLQPDVLYLTSTAATNVGNVRLGFLELEKGSALWAMLANEFNTFGTECSELPTIQVCNNERRLCNLFVDGASDPKTRCSDYLRRHNQCQPFMDKVTPDNYPYDGQRFPDIVCPADITCQKVARYLVNWNMSRFGAKDALNSLLVRKIYRSKWINRSGVCTNTYKNVFSHVPAATTNLTAPEAMFLESKCSNATLSQPSFCWLTGYYNKLTDLPGDQAGNKRLPEELFSHNPNLFSCYRFAKQNRTQQLVNNFGILFGWLGTIVLVFHAVFSAWIKVRHTLVRFLRPDSIFHSTTTSFNLGTGSDRS